MAGIRKGVESCSQSSFYRSQEGIQKERKKKPMSVQQRVEKFRGNQSEISKQIENAITVARRKEAVERPALELSGKKREREIVCNRGDYVVYKKLETELKCSDKRIKNPFIAFRR